jgi:hypothetical protein
MALGEPKFESKEVVKSVDKKSKDTKKKKAEAIGLKVVKSGQEEVDQPKTIDRETIEAMEASINKYLDSIESGRLQGDYQKKLQVEYDAMEKEYSEEEQAEIEKLKSEAKDLLGDLKQSMVKLTDGNKNKYRQLTDKLAAGSGEIESGRGLSGRKKGLIFGINGLKYILSEIKAAIDRQDKTR